MSESGVFSVVARFYSFFLWVCVLVLPSLAQTNPYESNIRAFEQSDLRNPPPTNAILFLGSSTIVRWDTLEEAFPQFDVLNRGFGGSQASDVLFFYDRLVPKYHSPLIVFYEGDNDLAGGKSVDQVFADWTNFVGLVERDLPEANILFISVKPSPSRANLLPRVRELNERIQAYNAANPKLLFADVFTAMLNGSGQLRPELYVSDQLHLSAAGYEVWEAAVVPVIEAWAREYPVEIRKPETGRLLIDFGSPNSLSGEGGSAAVHWNNVPTSVGSSDSGVLSNLVTTTGDSSTAALRMVSRFNGANENGTVASAFYPASATRDSLFGNTETFSGLANVTPIFALTGLEPEVSYRVSFYASRLAVSDRRETLYTVSGASTNTVTLEVANNIDEVATIASVQPDATGTITVALSPGPNNNNANHFTYLGVLRVDSLAAAASSFLFDFGASGSTTTTQSGATGPSWNNVSTTLGTQPGGFLGDLVSTNGNDTGMGLIIVSPFNGVNENGTTAATNFPATATQDSLYGNTESFNGQTNVSPIIALTNLNSRGQYRLTFFASRTGVSDNRETRFTVNGRTNLFVDLNAANNVDAVAVLEQVQPDANNAMTIALTPGPNNNNANHFTYLGIVQLDWSIPPKRSARFAEPVVEQDRFMVKFNGSGGAGYRIESSTDLETWTELRVITLDALATGLELPGAGARMFYRAVEIP